jgi:hypothetical protein
LKSDSDTEGFVALVPIAMHRSTDADEPEDTIAQRPSRMHRSAGIRLARRPLTFTEPSIWQRRHSNLRALDYETAEKNPGRIPLYAFDQLRTRAPSA